MTDKIQSRPDETQAQKLTPEELEQVQGAGGANFVFGDGSVRFVSGGLSSGDLAVWRSNYGTGG